MDWSLLSPEQIAEELHTSLTSGLSRKSAYDILKKDGKNEVKHRNRFSFFERLFAHIKTPIIYILIIGGVSVFLIGHTGDAIIIFVVLIINLFIGMVQEGKASRTFKKIARMQEKTVVVLREGEDIIIPTKELVVGDIVSLTQGSYIPADIRIIEETELSINEAALTGEWKDVKKNIHTYSSKRPLAERTNMAWSGTVIRGGFGKGIVVATGGDTQFGSITKTLNEKVEQTPFQKSIAQLTHFLAKVIIIAIGIIFILGVFINDLPLIDAVLLSIAVAVAAIPEGLPAAVTFVLAFGMEALLKNGGLTRRLVAAETLGGVTTIIMDKTGTLTEGAMKLVGGVLPDGEYVPLNKDSIVTTFETPIRKLIIGALLGTDGRVVMNKEAKSYTYSGSPIDQGILKSIQGLGMERKELERVCPRILYIPFSSSRRVSLSFHKGDEKYHAYMVGSPEKIILSSRGWRTKTNTIQSFTKQKRDELIDEMNTYTKGGGRVIAVTESEVSSPPPDEVSHEKTLDEIMASSIFLGFLVFKDPVRQGMAEALRSIRSSGVNIVMATGDNEGTAVHVANEIGLTQNDAPAISGDMVEKMGDEELKDVVQNKTVFARMLPKQKLRLYDAFTMNGEIVAMTGDGINDTPTLHHAAVGIALSDGTEIAKEASDIVLLENSFKTIVRAIEEGRKIIQNLKKIIVYLLSTSLKEVYLIGFSLIIQAPLPLLPGQILWANVVEEAFISFGFALDRSKNNSCPDCVIQRKKGRHSNYIFTPELKKLTILISIATGIIFSALFLYLLSLGHPIEEIRSVMFVALSIDSMFFAFALRDIRIPSWKIPLKDTIPLFVSILFSIGALILVFIVPTLRDLLSLTPPTGEQLLLIILIGIITVGVVEFAKQSVQEKSKYGILRQ